MLRAAWYTMDDLYYFHQHWQCGIMLNPIHFLNRIDDWTNDMCKCTEITADGFIHATNDVVNSTEADFILAEKTLLTAFFYLMYDESAGQNNLLKVMTLLKNVGKDSIDSNEKTQLDRLFEEQRKITLPEKFKAWEAYDKCKRMTNNNIFLVANSLKKRLYPIFENSDDIFADIKQADLDIPKLSISIINNTFDDFGQLDGTYYGYTARTLYTLLLYLYYEFPKTDHTLVMLRNMSNMETYIKTLDCLQIKEREDFEAINLLPNPFIEKALFEIENILTFSMDYSLQPGMVNTFKFTQEKKKTNRR